MTMLMKLLYLSLHPPLDPSRPVTGGQVRDAGLRQALATAGHEIKALAPLPADHRGEKNGFYESPEALRLQISLFQPDLILVNYWSLLSHLPPTDVPVVLDFIAPRLLEAMYQGSGELEHEARQLLSLLPKADHFLVGNQRQHDALVTLLLLCGFDCRERTPISLVPIAASAPAGDINTTLSPLVLINAGVDWPWRQSGDYLRVIEASASADPTLCLRQLSGPYPGGGDTDQPQARHSTLVSHTEMRSILAGCHIGIELCQRNPEREFSHSFRMMEYLQAGLPVLVNDWLPAATMIRDHDAGWLIESPAHLQAVLESIRANPQVVLDKAEGVRNLVNHIFQYSHCIQPLLDYLAAPTKAPRQKLNLLGTAAPSSMPARHEGKLRHVLKECYQLLFARRRPAPANQVLMVTRPDLFPTNHGAAVKIVRTAEALSRTGITVWLATDSRREYFEFQNGEMTTHAYPGWLRWLGLPRPIGLLRLLLKGLPASNAFLYFPLTDISYTLRTLYLSTRFPIGAWLAEFPAYVKPCRVSRAIFGGRVVLVEHNVEYERIKAQVPGLSELGYQSLKQVELTMAAHADAVITVSDQDRTILSQDGVDPRKLHTIPHGVDLTGFRQAGKQNLHSLYNLPPDHRVLVYHGPYSYPPNLEAMTVMANEILPRLQARGLKVSVLAIGSQPPASPLHPHIHFIGSVDKLEHVLPSADLAVVPLLQGGGTRMKILDYFAAGIPVISTAKGIEGIPVVHGEHALILDDYAEIAAATALLLLDPATRQQLVANAGAFVDSLSWDAIVARYVPLLFK